MGAPVAARIGWRSDVYDHYDVSIRRDVTASGAPSSLTYIFTCKSSPNLHKQMLRPRMKTNEGTSNLIKTRNACLEAQGVPLARKQDDLATTSYTPAGHRALIAMRAAKSARPFNSVLDEDYQAEVQMLRPGATIPHPITVSRDVNAIYEALSVWVMNYLVVCFMKHYLVSVLKYLLNIGS